MWRTVLNRIMKMYLKRCERKLGIMNKQIKELLIAYKSWQSRKEEWKKGRKTDVRT